MKTALGAFTALLIGGALYVQPAHAQLEVRPAPGFSVQIGPGAPPPPEPRRDEWREREGYYGSGWEEKREERWREERRARERCDRILNPIERDRCFHGLSNGEGEFGAGVLDLANQETMPSDDDATCPVSTLPSRGATCQRRQESFTAAPMEIGGI